MDDSLLLHVLGNSDVLRQPADPVDFDTWSYNERDALVVDLEYAMDRLNGVGMAAPQIGRSVRAFVWQPPSDDDPDVREMFNPEIIEESGSVKSQEGCLSVPGWTNVVERPKELIVEGLDVDGNEITVEAEGLEATILQHEIDHLSGKLFLDRLSPFKRSNFRMWYKKQRRNNRSVYGWDRLPDIEKDVAGNNND